MKQLKALDILRGLCEETAYYVGDDALIKYYQEAISELEALQAPKTCDGCKWEAYKGNLLTSWQCHRCARLWNDGYEPKETQ